MVSQGTCFEVVLDFVLWGGEKRVSIHLAMLTLGTLVSYEWARMELG